MTLKTYWHILTCIANYITIHKAEKFTKDELHEIFKYVYNVKSTKQLTPEEWGEYIVNIITGCLCVLDIPPSVFLPKDTGGIQWENFDNDNEN